MRSLGVRLPILAITAWAGIGLSVSAMGYRYGETVYVSPTAATFGWPTSYYASASYVVPTAYGYSSYVPTTYSYWPTTYRYLPTTYSYLPTAYSYVPAAYDYGYAPATLGTTSYLTTGYSVRRGLFGRTRLVERPVVASYATSYLPTTYFAPSYYATSYATSSYVPTVYSPPVYSPTIYRPTVYTPTVYTPRVYTPTAYDYSPTLWETSYVSSPGYDCDQVAWNTPRAVAPSVGYSTPAPSYPAPPSDRGSKTVRSEPGQDPTIPSSAASQPAEEPPLSSSVQDTAKSATNAGRADSPPVVPSVPRQQSTAQPPAAGRGNRPAPTNPGANTPKPAAPAAPGADPTEPDLTPAPIDNPTTNRQSLRPSYGLRPTTRTALRNVLIGRVETDAGEPLGEVPISATNRENSAIRRAGMTNAFGNFAIRLDDGDWTVNVRTPSGRVYPVRSVTVTNGVVMDNQEGREVRNLIISY